MTGPASLLAALVVAGAVTGGDGALDPARQTEARRIVTIEVRPAGLVDDEELADLLELEVPGSWDDARIDLTRENLQLTGRFARVEIASEPSGSGVALVFLVAPKPWARRIVFEGRRQLSPDRLLEGIDLRHFGVVDEGVVAAAVVRIAELYVKEGYPRPQVGARSRSLGDDGATEVVFTIRETPLPRLARLALAEDGRGPWHQRMLVRASLLAARIGMELRGANQVRLERLAEKQQRRLRDLGYAEATVTVARSTAGEDESLTLEMVYGRRITIRGPGLGRSTLREVTRLWKNRRRPLTDRAIERFARSAREALRERGYLQAEVAPRVDERADEVRLVLEAQRGTRSYVQEVVFSGNASLPEDELRAAVGLASPRWLGLLRSRPGPQAVAASERAVKALYASRGFADATVEASVTPGEGTPQTVTFTIDEGSRIVVGAVELSGVSRLPVEDVEQLLGLQEGEAFSQLALDRGMAAIASAYRDQGYSQTTVRSSLGEVDGEGRVDVTVHVEEGERAVLGPTIVQGAFKTRPAVIQRLYRQQRGDPFDLEELARLQQRLNRLGAFDGVTIAALERDGAPAGEVAARVAVREAVTGYYEIGIDFNSQRGFELIGTIGDRNLMHRGLAASVGALVGSKRNAVSASLTQPLTFGLPITSFVRFARLDDQTNPGFGDRRLGGEIGVEQELRRDLLVSLAYRLERQQPYDIEPDVRSTLEPETKLVASLNPALSWERRDDPFNATRGSFLSARLKISRRELGAAAAFDRVELDGRVYRSLSDSVTVAAALRLGLAEPRGGDPLPITERFFIGGASSHRGYPEKELGPKGKGGSPLGGESFVLGNLELRFPLWGPLDGGLFTDVGNVFLEGFPESDLRWAVGAGLRVRTPIGPVRVDVGFNLDPRDGEDGSVVHVAIGHAF